MGRKAVQFQGARALQHLSPVTNPEGKNSRIYSENRNLLLAKSALVRPARPKWQECISRSQLPLWL